VSEDRKGPEDELPPTEEEVAASKRLRDALEDPSIVDPDADLARSLRAAFDPSPIAASAHAEIVDDVPTAEALLLAAELRDALEADPVVEALAAAWRPKDINSIAHRQIVVKALPPAAKQGSRVVRVTFGFVAGAIAIAASVVVWMNAPHAQSELPLARARSTQPLFPSYDGFKSGEANATARIDKIAIARAGDYRDNRFAKWGHHFRAATTPIPR
jgi:hypothetical protein